MSASEAVETNIREVASAISRAREAWQGWDVGASAWLGLAPKDQVLGAIASREKSAAKLATRGRALAASAAPQKQLDAWLRDMRDLASGLVEDAGEAASVGFVAVVADTAKATAADTAKLAADVGGPLLWAVRHWWVLALTVGGLYVWLRWVR